MFRHAWVGLVVLATASWTQAASEPVVVVVMDPLSAKLSCDCVKGYAQRRYERLAAHLENTLGRKVEMVWAESLAKAQTDLAGRTPDLIIGKHSVVVADAKTQGWSPEPVALLTGKDGKTTQTGLIVVRRDDPALTAEDLGGYRIIFGPADCDEKSAAIVDLLKVSDVAVPETLETAESCTSAVKRLVALPADEPAAAVISSYAEPLLAGCGTIQKGDLRIVGVTEEVPFITVFVNQAAKDADRSAWLSALLDVGTSADLLTALESKSGFVPFQPTASVATAKKK